VRQFYDAHFARKESQSGTEKRAAVLIGGKRVARPGYFLEPTILTNIKPENPVYYQKFFAHVALIFRVNNDEEAVKLANDSPYGLGGSVVTKDIEAANRHPGQVRYSHNPLHEVRDEEPSQRAYPSKEGEAQALVWGVQKLSWMRWQIHVLGA
jgi:aldehyde dehydrogenase family protein